MSAINLKLKTYDELIYEITKLNTDKYLLEKKLQQKENIIKEVSEKLENMDANLWNEAHKYNFDFDELLGLLDKVDKEK